MCLGQQDGLLFINDTQHQRPAIFRLSALPSMIHAAEIPIVSNSRWNEKGQEGRKGERSGAFENKYNLFFTPQVYHAERL